MAVWLEIKEMDMAIQGRWLVMGAFRGICMKQTKTKSRDRDSDAKFV